MADHDGDRRAIADDLRSSLAALRLGQRRWIADLAEACPDDGLGEAAFTVVLRRWQEQLAQLRWHLHRADHRLLHLALAPGPRPPVEVPPAAPAPDWRGRIERWADRLHLPTSYRRLERCLDADAEAVTADITTDLARVATVAWGTLPALDLVLATRHPGPVESLAFYAVVAPWRRQGLAALGEVQRWLAETLEDEGDW